MALSSFFERVGIRLNFASLASTVSFEDFITSFFLAGIGIVTMPMKIYSMMKFGVTPEINALAACLLALTVGLLFLQQKFKTARGS